MMDKPQANDYYLQMPTMRREVRKYWFNLLVPGLILVLFAAAACAQREASSRANYSKVYEATGTSTAARAVRQKINLTLITAIARSRRPATSRRSSGARPRSTGNSGGTRPAAAGTTAPQTNVASFRPDPALDTNSTLAETLGSSAQEKAILKVLFATIKTAFENEVAAKGRKNNLAAAFTFFIGSTAMVYHNDPEPSDAALDKLWDGLDTVFDETPEFAKLSDREKQEMYDTIIAFSGLVLATYMEGKNNKNAETIQTARSLAGVLIQLVLKTDPNKLRFGKDGLVVS